MSLSSLLAGGLSYLGGAERNEAQLSSAREVMAFNAQQSNLDRQFQLNAQLRSMGWLRNMSNTAHQREAADLRKAGLNRILTVTRGPGASTPAAPGVSGSRASGVQANIENALGQAVSSAVHARTQSAQVAQLKKQQALTGAQTATQHQVEQKTKEEINEVKARIGEINASNALKGAQHNKEQMQALLYQEQAANAAVTRTQQRQHIDAFKTRLFKLHQDEQIDKSTYGTLLNWVGRIFQMGSSARSIIPNNAIQSVTHR